MDTRLRDYYLILLRVTWGGLDPKRQKRLRRQAPGLMNVIDQVIKYDMRERT